MKTSRGFTWFRWNDWIENYRLLLLSDWYRQFELAGETENHGLFGWHRMSAPVVFYAWQNDRPRESARDFIRQAALAAVRQAGSTMRVEDSPRLDHDTEYEAGTPAIAETILRKIKHSAIIIADMTFCSEILDETPERKVRKKNPNSNVMLELGRSPSRSCSEYSTSDGTLGCTYFTAH